MSRVIEFVKDLVWPRTCAVCGHPSDRPDRYVCAGCVMRLPFQPTAGLCRRCGRPAQSFSGEYLCDECVEYRPHFDRAGAALRFEGEARDLMNAFKFRDRLELREDLVDFLEGFVRTRFRLGDVDEVVPMPATLSHRWLRGYNPAGDLARSLARRLQLPCRAGLRRIGSPHRQGGLDERDRRTNVKGTFSATRRLSGKVLLVDDILTTGSTLSEASRVLKEAGAETVFAAAVCRAVRG